MQLSYAIVLEECLGGGDSVVVKALDYHAKGPRFETRPWQN